MTTERMTLERFREILLEEGCPSEEVEDLWEARLSDDLSEVALRYAARMVCGTAAKAALN